MRTNLSAGLMLLLVGGILISGCSSLPATRDITAQKPAKEMGISTVEYMALDEPEDTYWD